MLLKNFVAYRVKTPYSGFKSLDNGLRHRELMWELVVLVVLEIELKFLEFLKPVWKTMLEIGMRVKLREKIGNYKTFWINQFRGQASIVLHGNAGVNNTINVYTFIQDETVWDEDWSITGGRTTADRDYILTRFYHLYIGFSSLHMHNNEFSRNAFYSVFSENDYA